MRKFLKLMIATMAMAGMATFPALATEYTTDTVNFLKVGTIAVKPVELEMVDGMEKPYDGSQYALPGETISKINRIVNEGEPAWIRVETQWDGDPEFCLSDEYLGGISEDWKEIGGYYYLDHPLESEQSVDFSTSMHFPSTWTESLSLKSFTFSWKVEAVQAANFTPDWAFDDPWFGTVIEQSVAKNGYKKGTSNSKFSVIFKDGTEGLIKTSDDFFGNFGAAMPGDTLIERVQISNAYNRKVRIYFEGDMTKDLKLLDKVELEIKNGNEIIYSGKLGGKIKKTLLGTYKPGDQSDFTFTLKIPSDLDNAYALAVAEVKWIFSAEVSKKTYNRGDQDADHGPGVTDADLGDSTAPTSPSMEDGGNQGESGNGGHDWRVPDTGDHFFYGVFLVLIGAIGVVFFMIKRKEDEE